MASPARQFPAPRARAAAVETQVGDNLVPPSHEHRLFVMAGAPIRAWCACEGRRPESEHRWAGEIDVVPAGASGVWTDEASTTIHHVALCPTLLLDAAERVGRRPAAVELAPEFSRRDARVAHLAAALLPGPGDASARDDLFAESVALALATQLLGWSSEAPVLHSLGSRRLRLVTDYIEANLGEPLGLNELAGVAGLSRAHFATAFKAATGFTPHRYLVRRRVESARDRLLRGEAACAVAADTGFAHQSHLAKSMRRVLGVTPGQLRSVAPERRD